MSHHLNDLEKAKRLVKHLAPLEKNYGVDVVYWDSILPGTDIDKNAYDQVNSSYMIICLLSADYLADNHDEIEWIKASKSYKQGRFIPVPISSCLWKDVFGNLKSLPRTFSSKESLFDNDSQWFEVASGVKEILEEGQVSRHRFIQVMPARADSTSEEQSQEQPPLPIVKIPLKSNEIWIPIKGNSMSPIFEDGDVVIGRLAENNEITLDKPNKKKVFAIRTKTRGTLLKYIGSIEGTTIVLVSENSSHEDITLDKSEIGNIFLIVRSIKIRTE